MKLDGRGTSQEERTESAYSACDIFDHAEAGAEHQTL
jgi:hypothetical protein